MTKKQAKTEALAIAARETECLCDNNLGIGGKAEKKIREQLQVVADELWRRHDRLKE